MNCLTPSQPVTPGEEVKIDVKAEGFTLDTANSVFYDSEDVKLPGTKLLDILGGVRVTAVTGNTYTVVIPADGQKATVSTTGDVTATLTGRNLVIDVKGAGTVTLKMPEAGVGTITLDKGVVGTIKEPSITTGTFGETKASFTLEAPAWAYKDATPGSNVSLTYDIYVDGVPTLSATAPVVDAASGTQKLVPNAAKTEYKVTDLEITASSADASHIAESAAKGKTVSIVIDSITWKNAKIEFVDNTGKPLSMASIGTNTEPWLTTDKTTGANVKFQINTISSHNAKWAISGAKPVTDGDPVSGIAITDVSAAQTSTDKYYAEGGKVVTITVTPDQPIAPKFNINLNGTTGAAYSATLLKDVAGLKTTNISDAEKAAVTLAASSSAYQVNENGSATLTFTVDNYTNKLSKGLILKYTVNGSSEKTVELTGNGAGTFTGTDQLMLITADQAVVVTAIETELVNFRVKDAEVVMDGTNLQVVVDFGQELKTVRVTDDTAGATDVLIYAGTKPSYTGSGASNITSAGKTGSKLVIVFDSTLLGAAPWNGTTVVVTVDAAVSNADDEWNKQVEITLEKNTTTGVWSVKEWDDNI